MFKLSIVAVVSALFFTACQPQTHVVKSDHQYQEIKEGAQSDAAVEEMIAPYKKEVEREMTSVIGYTAKMLTKAKPESTLGNWAADLVHTQCERYLKQKVDFAVLNYGGLRIPSLPKGAVTKGKIFELMPFDNTLVVLEMKGSELGALFHHIAAKGGWPISKHLQLKVRNGKALDATIGGQKILKEQVYRIATNDYIANGGDKCTFFKGKPQIQTNKLFRDAIIEFVEAETKAGKKLDANIEDRILVLK